MSAIVVLITAKNVSEARKIARTLVQKKLVACCNIVPGLRSVYQWKGEILEDPEALMVCKTVRRMFPAVEKQVRALHSYSVPEIIALPVVQGSRPYLKWIGDSVSRKRRRIA